MRRALGRLRSRDRTRSRDRAARPRHRPVPRRPDVGRRRPRSSPSSAGPSTRSASSTSSATASRPSSADARPRRRPPASSPCPRPTAWRSRTSARRSSAATPASATSARTAASTSATRSTSAASCRRPTLGPDDPAWLRLRGPNLWPAALPELRAGRHGVDGPPRGARPARCSAPWPAALELPAGHVRRRGRRRPRCCSRSSATSRRADARRRPTTARASAAHRDTGFLSFVHQDDVGGLQVERDGALIDVPPIARRARRQHRRDVPARHTRLLQGDRAPGRQPAAGRRADLAGLLLQPAAGGHARAGRPAAPPRRRWRPGGESDDPDNPILANYGDNSLKVRLRAHPDVAAAPPRRPAGRRHLDAAG